MNERRRTMLFSPSNIPTENGVYIESVEHKFYLTDDWDTADTANSIAVVTDECKFRIALTQASSKKYMSSSYTDPWETYLSGTTNSGITDRTVAKTDYSGATNTRLIIEKCNASSGYPAGWCDAYIFPDGETKGYLPALGELYLAYQNKNAVDAALVKCRKAALKSEWYWSSTFYGIKQDNFRECWVLDWTNGAVSTELLSYKKYVRAFAPL